MRYRLLEQPYYQIEIWLEKDRTWGVIIPRYIDKELADEKLRNDSFFSNRKTRILYVDRVAY